MLSGSHEPTKKEVVEVFVCVCAGHSSSLAKSGDEAERKTSAVYSTTASCGLFILKISSITQWILNE